MTTSVVGRSAAGSDSTDLYTNAFLLLLGTLAPDLGGLPANNILGPSLTVNSPRCLRRKGMMLGRARCFTTWSVVDAPKRDRGCTASRLSSRMIRNTRL